MPDPAPAPTPSLECPFVVFHVGDLHLTELSPDDAAPIRRRQRRLVSDAKLIFEEIAALPAGSFDFVYLPGDMAQNGLAGEYRILAGLLAAHPALPVCLVPGDHDRQFGSMAAFASFRSGLKGAQAQDPPVPVRLADLPAGPPPPAPPLRALHQYYAVRTYGGVRCLFLDMVSAGYGRNGFGLDFRLGKPQFRWLERELARAAAEARPVAVFTHAYPADMHNPDRAPARRLAGLLWGAGVRLVEMGHTHYNELAPDGRTLYAAARSVGQNEEGPVGYAVAAIDEGAVSWRFKPLQSTWPFVLITSPADRRLATGAPAVTSGVIQVRAVAFSDQPAHRVRCACSVDGGAWTPMTRRGAGPAFVAQVPWPPGSRRLSVRARDGRGSGPDFVDVDAIEPAAPGFTAPAVPLFPGSDAQALLTPWPEKGIRGDQLGPNKNGRSW